MKFRTNPSNSFVSLHVANSKYRQNLHVNHGKSCANLLLARTLNGFFTVTTATAFLHARATKRKRFWSRRRRDSAFAFLEEQTKKQQRFCFAKTKTNNVLACEDEALLRRGTRQRSDDDVKAPLFARTTKRERFWLRRQARSFSKKSIKILKA